MERYLAILILQNIPTHTLTIFHPALTEHLQPESWLFVGSCTKAKGPDFSGP